jgi:hypothetical protein
VQAAEIHRHFYAQYVDIVLLWRCVFARIEVFKKSQTSVTDEETSGCPSP